MDTSYIIIITLLGYVLGAVTKVFIDVIPNKYIPLQNVIVGLISIFIYYFTKVEPSLFNSIIICLIATMVSGCIADLKKIAKGGDKNE